MVTEGVRDGHNKHLLNDITFRVSAFEVEDLRSSLFFHPN